MSGGISVVDFKHIPGKNDLEYIKLLKKALHRQITLTNKAVAKIRVLSAAQPERIKGRWEIYIISMLAGEGCKCSECGFEGVPYWNFCPNCGADMRGEQNE